MQRLIPALLALLLLAPALAAPAAPAAAHQAPAQGSAGPPAPPLAPAPQAELEQVASCSQALADPSVSVEQGSPWKVYRRDVTRATDAVAASRALFFAEDSDGDPASGPDIDAAGQPFGPIPGALAELAGALRFRYAAGSTRPGDLLRVEIYLSEPPTPAGLVASRDLDVAALDTGESQIFEWEIVDTTALDRLRGRATAVFVVSMVSGAGGGAQRLWADDLTANLCVPGASLSGQVRQGAQGAADADVLLVRTDAAGERVAATARTAADGGFTFGAVPALEAGASYRLWYLNTSATASRDDRRLGFWAGPTITALAAGQQVTGLTLSIANTPLGSPMSYGSVVAAPGQPARFSWAARSGVAGERHRLCIYNPQRADPATGQPARYCAAPIDPAAGAPAVAVSVESLAGAPGFGFAYGRSYRWYVEVFTGEPDAPGRQYGHSFFEHDVTFLPAAAAAPAAPPVLPSGDPAAGAPDADWTLLIYAAADNALGDPARAPHTALPAAQLAAAQAAADAHPSVNVVSYVDGYGDGGAQLCAYPPGAAPDCRARPEPNTAAPADLAAFISYGRTRYPADRTALLIISPGSAIGDLAPDESAGGAAMGLQQLRAAYAAAGLGADTKLDLVIYQAPNLGNLDTLRATEPYARYAVAAADQIWQLGAIAQLVPLLGGAARADAAAAARGAVTAYQGAVDATVPGRMVSVAAYDLARIPAVAQAADDLAFVIGEALTTDRTALLPILGAARRTPQRYDSSGNGRHGQLATATGAIEADEDALVDLRGMAVALRDAAGTPGSVRDEASDLLAALDATAGSPVIASVQRSGPGLAGAQVRFAGASGLAVFFPGPQRLGGQPALTHAYLYGPDSGPPRDGDWATMLRAYLQGVIGAGPGGVTASGAGGARLLPTPGGLVRTDVSLPLLRR